MSQFTKVSQNKMAVTVCLTAALALGLSMSAHAGGNKKGGHKHGHSDTHKTNNKANKKRKGKGKNKARMTICHYEMDGSYKLKSLPVKAAIKHLANHELDKEPVVGSDGVESCVAVQPPQTSCIINIDGTDYTIADYLESAAINDYLEPDSFQVTGFNTDANSCDVITDATVNRLPFILYNNVPGWFNDGLGPRLVFVPSNNNTLIIGTQEQYNDCAFDIETITNASSTCPAPFFD